MAMSGGRIRTYFDGAWHEGDVGVAGAATHGLWQGTCVFDGARAFEGVAPDLDLHCARVNRSAEAMGLRAVHSDGEVLEIAREGIAGFNADAALYVRPMYWSASGDASLIAPKDRRWVSAENASSIPFCRMIDRPSVTRSGGRISLPSVRIKSAHCRA